MRKYRTGTKWCIWRWTDTDSGYIDRLHLGKTPWFAVCLHWINHADREPYEHDHPVTFLSIILRGWYIERRNGVVRKRRWLNFIRATPNDVHRIISVPPKGVLTLCLMGPKRREWGFHAPKQSPVFGGKTWIHWQAYYTLQREGWIE